MLDPFAGYVEVLRGIYGSEQVRTGTPATAAQLAAIESELGCTLPASYKALATSHGYLCVGDPAALVIYVVAAAGHGCSAEVDLVRATSQVRAELGRSVTPLIRMHLPNQPRQLCVVDARGALRLVHLDEPDVEETVLPSFRDCVQAAVQATIEANLLSQIEAAGGVPDDLANFDEPQAGEATLQIHAVPPAVVAAIKAEPAVADEVTLYTSVAEFREQTVQWEKTARDTDPPAVKEMVRRMRALLKQPGIAKLHDLVGESIDIIRWADAIVICLGEESVEARALRGTTSLPTDGSDTIHMLSIAEVKQVAAVIRDSEQRLRAGYQPEALRARGLYNVDAPNEAAFLEELCAMWDNVVEGIQQAAKHGWGWLIRRTEG
jgi:hypothetical protein